jgi:hypothetical protein
MDRRSFLKTSAAVAVAVRGNALSAVGHAVLPAIPSLTDLASIRMTHNFMELFNLPIAMNDWGYAQAAKSVTAISAIGFPPYACSGTPDIPWSPGYLTTCELLLEDSFPALSGDPASAIAYTWYPHCVVREQAVDSLKFRTTFFLPPDTRAVLQKIEIRNTDSRAREVTIDFDMRAAVTRKSGAWFVNLPGEGDNRAVWNAAQGRLTFAAQHSAAASPRGFIRRPLVWSPGMCCATTCNWLPESIARCTT